MSWDLLYLHPVKRVHGSVSLLDKVCVLHVFSQALQEAERLVEDHRHGDFGELLEANGSFGGSFSPSLVHENLLSLL